MPWPSRSSLTQVNSARADAGPDQTVSLGKAALLGGFVAYSGGLPVIQWRVYSGPGTVTFGDASQTNTTANFAAPGVYTLILSADDGLHAIAYSAKIVTATQLFNLDILTSGPNVTIGWNNGIPPFSVQRSVVLPATQWETVATTSANSLTLPMSGAAAFFRVRGN